MFFLLSEVFRAQFFLAALVLKENDVCCVDRKIGTLLFGHEKYFTNNTFSMLIV